MRYPRLCGVVWSGALCAAACPVQCRQLAHPSSMGPLRCHQHRRIRVPVAGVDPVFDEPLPLRGVEGGVGDPAMLGAVEGQLGWKHQHTAGCRRQVCASFDGVDHDVNTREGLPFPKSAGQSRMSRGQHQYHRHCGVTGSIPVSPTSSISPFVLRKSTVIGLHLDPVVRCISNPPASRPPSRRHASRNP